MAPSDLAEAGHVLAPVAHVPGQPKSPFATKDTKNLPGSCAGPPPEAGNTHGSSAAAMASATHRP